MTSAADTGSVSQPASLEQPACLKTALEGDGVRLTLHVPEKLRYFEGHFPGCAILPGVVQMKWAVEFGRQHFRVAPRFVRLANVKFMRVIVPGRTIALALRPLPDEGGVAFQYRIDSDVCSSGQIVFAH